MTPSFRICFLIAALLFFTTFSSMRQEPRLINSTAPTAPTAPNTELASNPKRLEEINCLARTVYFEARGESVAGQIAVAQVTINRVNDDNFPDTVCGVIHEKHHGVCQYTWFCNKKPLVVHDKKLFANLVVLATTVYDYYYISKTIPDIVDGATHFQRGAHHLVGGENSVITAHIDHMFFYRVANT